MCGIVALSRSRCAGPGPGCAADRAGPGSAGDPGAGPGGAADRSGDLAGLGARARAALAAMPWRGPDGSGVATAPGAAVGMCRLRVRSAARDRVPFDGNGDGDYALNGEVYGAGRAGSLSPVPGGLEEARRASGAQPVVDGMWAVARLHPDGVVDLRRDPWGIKPLWVRQTPGEVVACSELPALLRATAHRPPRVRPDAVAQLLLSGSVVDGGSYWDDVAPLAPGAGLRLRDGTAEPLPDVVPVPDDGPAESIVDAVRASVHGVLQSDRPIGLALSGGLDSTIVALHAQEAGLEDVATVSVLPAGAGDGTADLAALGLPRGTHATWRHHHVEVGPGDVLGLLADVTRYWGAPTGLTSAPLYLALARAAAGAGIVVLLAGEGADELFGGYRSYLGLAGDTDPRAFYLGARRRELVGVLLGPELCARATDALHRRLGAGRGPSAVLAHERTLSLGPLLERTDTAMMAHSVEARTPFLHGAVPAVASRLSWDRMVGGGQTKVALRRAYAEALPAFADEVKKPFRAPWAEWITAGPLHDEVREILSGAAGPLAGLGVRPDGVRAVLSAAVAGDAVAAGLCFTLCSLAFWADRSEGEIA